MISNLLQDLVGWGKVQSGGKTNQPLSTVEEKINNKE